MGLINILDFQTANKIAAGEVVDRPASALKELIENAVDAGSTRIFAKISGGGIEMLQVSDNGSGILAEDMHLTIKRHATGKIKTADDLDGVATLGFRGEALAALSSVSRLEIVSRHRETEQNTRLICDEHDVSVSEYASPWGTTVTARDLFYNLPARRKFLKSVPAETAACTVVAEHMALAYPEIEFRYYIDDEIRFVTMGDGDLYEAIYAVYGKKVAETFTKAEFVANKIKVSGYISKPENPRASRRGQVFFVNRRSVQNKTAQAGLERAYDSYIQRGKFPACVLNIEVDPFAVDVNVHPSKAEIKFSDDRLIFQGVYCAVRNAFAAPDAQKIFFGDSAGNFAEPQPVCVNAEFPETPFDGIMMARPEYLGNTSPDKDEYTQVSMDGNQKGIHITPLEPEVQGESRFVEVTEEEIALLFGEAKTDKRWDIPEEEEPAAEEKPQQPEAQPMVDIREEPIIDFTACLTLTPEELEDDFIKPNYKYVGELWNTYLVCQNDYYVMFIDKHAAHERLVYEKFLKDRTQDVAQELLTGIVCTLSPMEYQAIKKYRKYFELYGYNFDVFGRDTAILRTVPAVLAGTKQAEDLFYELCAAVTEKTEVPVRLRAEKTVYTAACKKAIRAREKTSRQENIFLAKQVLEPGGIRYCPHGRPVMIMKEKGLIDSLFDR